jgi:transcriptional regulator with XRE-family HTH domain
MPTVTRERLGSLVKRLRGEQGLTAEQLARKAGVGIQTLRYCEANVSSPNSRTIVRLAGALGTPVGTLLAAQLPETFVRPA